MSNPILPPAEEPDVLDPLSPFARIRHETADGGEYWRGRELAAVLGYVQWRNFRSALDKAQIACANSGRAIGDHFAKVSKMVTVGSGAQRQIEDWHLSRYACYLIVQNADPNKPIVALGQTYFAVQTRRAELADALAADALAGMSEVQKRLFVRQQLVEQNTQLATAARQAGVVGPEDFGVFQDHGYMGLYAGERARDIHQRKGLAPHQRILDYMGSDELAANLFRASVTRQRLEHEPVQGPAAANQTHYDVGQAVRAFLIEQGATPPEALPTPADSIQQLRRREERRLQQDAAGQQTLFDVLPEGGEEL